jgi:hypothetical protein
MQKQQGLQRIALKQRVSTGPARKKTPYELQYQEFDRRTSGKCRLPSIGGARKRAPSVDMDGREYLALAQELKENRGQVLFGEVRAGEEEGERGEELAMMKGLLSRMKERYGPGGH